MRKQRLSIDIRHDFDIQYLCFIFCDAVFVPIGHISAFLCIISYIYLLNASVFIKFLPSHCSVRASHQHHCHQ